MCSAFRLLLQCSVLGAGTLPAIDKCAELVKKGARIVPAGIKVHCLSLLHLQILIWKGNDYREYLDAIIVFLAL